jgi:hypothetical protein
MINNFYIYISIYKQINVHIYNIKIRILIEFMQKLKRNKLQFFILCNIISFEKL